MTGKSGRPVNEDRQTAIDLGFKTYTGTPHSKCGTTERYVSGGGCVQCARAIATEQREARKYLRQHAEEFAAEGGVEDMVAADEIVNHDPEEDTAAQEELDEQDTAMHDDAVAEQRPDPQAGRDRDDAAAERSRQAIEDLM